MWLTCTRRSDGNPIIAKSQDEVRTMREKLVKFDTFDLRLVSSTLLVEPGVPSAQEY